MGKSFHEGRAQRCAIMCAEAVGNRVPYTAYLEAFSHLKIRLFAPGGAPGQLG